VAKIFFKLLGRLLLGSNKKASCRQVYLYLVFIL